MVGSNWRNLKVVSIVSLLAAGNLLFHLEAHFNGSADYAIRLGIGTMVLLISLVGGRVVPSFTRNWLARRDSARQAAGRLPRPFERFDAITIAVSAVALALWIALPFERATGLLLIFAGLMQLVRLTRWAGDRTVGDRLVLVLHVGYAFVPLGFFLVGGAALGLVPPGAGIHAWTGGAVAVMMLAVMTRASSRTYRPGSHRLGRYTGSVCRSPHCRAHANLRGDAPRAGRCPAVDFRRRVDGGFPRVRRALRSHALLRPRSAGGLNCSVWLVAQATRRAAAVDPGSDARWDIGCAGCWTQ